MDDVASDLISNIEGYQQLLTTLALGVCAGTFALATQIIFHNKSNPSSKVNLRFIALFSIGIILEFLSIISGVATKASLTASVPALHMIKWQDVSAITQLQTAGLSHIQFFSSCQIVLFSLGILCLLIVLFSNLRLLK